MDGRERREVLRELTKVAEGMLQGTLSQTTRTCGTPGCRCHQGERHGPHTYLTFKTAQGRSNGLYVPQVELERFEEGVASWKRFWELATRIAADNRERIAARRRTEKAKVKARARQA